MSFIILRKLVDFNKKGRDVLFPQRCIIRKKRRNMGIKPSTPLAHLPPSKKITLTAYTNPTAQDNPPPAAKASQPPDTPHDTPLQTDCKPASIARIHLPRFISHRPNTTRVGWRTLMMRVKTTRIENQTFPGHPIRPRIPIPQIPMYQRRFHASSLTLQRP